jgi:hypothetical protein
VPETDVKYLGTAATVSGETPLIVNTKDEQAREKVRRETSGGVLFTDAEDMPSLERLLEEYRVTYAVLEATPVIADIAPVEQEITLTDWRERARHLVRDQAALADQEGPMEESYVFLAALDEDSLDSFVDRAYALLDDAKTDEPRWSSFLAAETAVANSLIQHDPLPIAAEHEASKAQEVSPLLRLDDIDVMFSRGAFGGPRPLIDRIES